MAKTRKERIKALESRGIDPDKVDVVRQGHAPSNRSGLYAGRPPGTPNILPYGAVKALGTAKFRIRKDLPFGAQQDAADIGGYALERMLQVLGGSIHSKKAPTILKAAIAVREEVCDPLVKEHKLSGAISLEDMVAQAAALAAAKAVPK